MKNRKYKIIIWVLAGLLILVATSVIMASIPDPREVSDEAKIKKYLSNTRAMAELYFEENNNSFYVSEEDNVCYSDSGIRLGYEEAKDLGGDGDCFTDSDSWIAWIRLEDDKKTAWCVDSQNSTEKINIEPRPVLSKDVFCKSFSIKKD